ncbi:nuclear transport factor 2 family protein [Actinophytocola glycyrrhizae]|uniref:Nuclear transport factor 2 family protein n=1 Tax=Actinophytocola glycyrrhizae TaxID=2044873 RepID=A0ABV9S7M8_9PSEU
MATPIARATAKKQPGGLDTAFLKDWADRNLAAWDALDAEAVADTCTDDIVWTDPSVPWPIRGRKELVKFINALATSYQDLKITRVSDPIPSPTEQFAIARYTMTGTLSRLWPYTNMAATGQAMSVRCIDEWTFRDGLLASNVTIYDCLHTARQLGIVPPPDTLQSKIMSKVQHLRARRLREKASCPACGYQKNHTH